MMDWLQEHWFVEALCIIFGCYILLIIVAKVMDMFNGPPQS